MSGRLHSDDITGQAAIGTVANRRSQYVPGDERLEQIFSLGFTTKAHGQGLGLHYSACAARELGGALTVRSDGPGRGAAFRLTLPVVPMRAARTTRSSARPLVAAELARS